MLHSPQMVVNGSQFGSVKYFGIKLGKLSCGGMGDATSV
jgi:hypothetical protein